MAGIEDFFDLENDQGFFKALHLNFSYQIGVLKEKFEKDPIVLFYEDLRSSPKAFIKAFCLITFSEINLEKVDFRKKHISYSEKQLKAIKFVSKYFNRAWAELHQHCFPKHKLFVNVLVRMAISSTTLPPGTSPGDWLLP